jgi:hypothetical protein
LPASYDSPGFREFDATGLAQHVGERGEKRVVRE